MSKYSVENFMNTLPAPILEDEHLKQLAEVAARVMLKIYDTRWMPAIYSKIDDLPEPVLDILAKDLKVDWYDYDAPIEEKRRLIRDSWYVHKRMGTKAAVQMALDDVWPNSIVEEWFDYSGDPYHFRIILEALSEDDPIYPEIAIERVRLFKPARAVLDNDQSIIKITCGIVINTISPKKTNKTYHVDVCGTLPGQKNLWRENGTEAEIITGPQAAYYHVPPLGGLHSGEYPGQSTNGRIWDDGISLGASVIEAAYTPRLCGTSLNSLM